jgi:hypothetical protein
MTSRPARHQVLKRRTSARANATLAATIILNNALELGIHVGVAPDGSDVILVAPLRVPRDVRRWFEIWLLDKFRDEVVDIIQRENADKQNAEVM